GMSRASRGRFTARRAGFVVAVAGGVTGGVVVVAGVGTVESAGVAGAAVAGEVAAGAVAGARSRIRKYTRFAPISSPEKNSNSPFTVAAPSACPGRPPRRMPARPSWSGGYSH